MKRKHTIRCSYRRAEISCKMLMMMKAGKLGWVEAGHGRSRAWQEQGQARESRSSAEVRGYGLEQEQDRSRVKGKKVK